MVPPPTSHTSSVSSTESSRRQRSPYETSVYGKQASQTTQYILERFTASERYGLWPQAKLHTQWPGKAEPGDPTYDNYAASNFAGLDDRDAQSAMNVHALTLLLDRIWPSIVFVHSQAGQYAWPLAQARPALVKAIVGIEPEDPLAGGVLEAFIASRGEVVAPLEEMDVRREPAGDLDSGVMRARIDDDDFIKQMRNGRQALGQVALFVADNHAERDGARMFSSQAALVRQSVVAA